MGDNKKNTQRDLEALIVAAHNISEDVGAEVEKAVQEGREHPLSQEEAAKILKGIIQLLRQKAHRKGDIAAIASLEGDIDDMVKEMVVARERARAGRGALRNGARPKMELVARNGLKPSPVQPRPCFHGREIPVTGGFVKTTELQQWDHNERLEIHLGQFRQQNNRNPTAEEILDIMLSKMILPGVSAADQFEIAALARSIAVNGVRKAPILDVDGTPLDGNRRIAACYFILNSDEFDTEQKRRAEYIYVWQLTDHATDEEREAVVVSLNFESDCKVDWPEYVKARKVNEQWEQMVALEPRDPGPQRAAQMKRELSKKFALGPDTSVVNRYLKMVDWATAFEEYHVNTREKDVYEARHRTSKVFQYFDELAKGATTEGVAHALRQDEGFKHLVFDLLYDGKFQNWRQIRELKLIYDNQEARDAMVKARDETDEELAEEHLENAMTIARSRRAEMREVGANSRIQSFVEWLEELPVRAFRDRITKENLMRLRKALRLVDVQAAAILGDGE